MARELALVIQWNEDGKDTFGMMESLSSMIDMAFYEENPEAGERLDILSRNAKK